MEEKQKKQINATAQVMHDLKQIWTPFKGRRIPEDHIFMKDLKSTEYYPEEGQVTIGKACLSGNYSLVFIELGRQTGKTELVNAISWYKGLLTPRASIYYFCPVQKQAKEIVWAKNRIQTMNAATALDLDKLDTFQNYGKKYIKGKPNNQEMRLSWINGSFIKVDGSNNYDEYRGITPDLIIFDEYREFRPGAYDAFKASTTTKKATIIVISTPAHAKGFYTDLRDYARNPDNTDAMYFQAPTWMNPHQDLDELMNIRNSYIQKGEMDVWLREYCAEFIVGGSRAIFPMLKGDEQVPHSKAMLDASRALDYYCICDPGSASKGSAFAVLFAAINPHTKRVVLMDELYLTAEGEKTVGVIEPMIREKLAELAPHLAKHDWQFYYDEAAAWFKNEMVERGYAFNPTNKKAKSKDDGLSTIKDALIAKKITWSSRCENLMWEMTNYVKNEQGQVPKKDDHLIDAFRYLIQVSHYHINYHGTGMERKKLDDGRTRWISIDQDLEAMGNENLLDDNIDCGFLGDFM